MSAVSKIRSVAMPRDLYGIGEIPPLGHVPEKMHAWAIRRELDLARRRAELSNLESRVRTEAFQRVMMNPGPMPRVKKR